MLAKDIIGKVRDEMGVIQMLTMRRFAWVWIWLNYSAC
jgi:hypothetical protein